jgi:hypothetical protein
VPTLLGPQVAILGRDVGLQGDALITAVAIAKPESGWRTDASNINPATGDDSHGLWQINLEAHPQFGPKERLYDPEFNAQCMFTISEGGTNWKPWSAYNRRLHLPFLPEARAAVAAIGDTGVTPAGETVGLPVPEPVYTPPPTASLVAGLSLVGPDSLEVEGEKLSGLCEVLSADLVRSIDEASTLTVTVLDVRRQLLSSEFAQQRSRTRLDGIIFELVDVAKDGNDVTLGFIDAVAAELIFDRGKVITQAPNTASRGEFLRRLTAEHPWIPFDVETGDLAHEELRTEPDESLWEAMGRIARRKNWRRLATANRLLIGSDDWLAQRTQPIVVREHENGIETIDFDYRTGVEVDELRFTCDALLWAGPPTQALTVEGLGWADGDWIVADISHRLGVTQARVRAIRKASVFPEPTLDADPDVVGAFPGVPTGAAAGVVAGTISLGAVSDRGFQWPHAPSWTSPFNACRTGLSCNTPCCRRHKGLDIGSALSTPVFAAKEGSVSVAHDRDDDSYGGYGRIVYVEHAGGVQTRYAHLDTLTVTRGMQVVRGQQIGTVGHSGNAEVGEEHTHFEVRVGGAAADPATYLP